MNSASVPNESLRKNAVLVLKHPRRIPLIYDIDFLSTEKQTESFLYSTDPQAHPKTPHQNIHLILVLQNHCNTSSQVHALQHHHT